MNNLPKVVACQLISCNVTTRCLTVTGGGSVGKCDRLNQLSCLLGNYNKVLLTYLLTYYYWLHGSSAKNSQFRVLLAAVVLE